MCLQRYLQTNGIAVLIASTQVKDFLGLQIEKMPGDFLGRMRAIVTHLSTFSLVSTLLGFFALAVILFCIKLMKQAQLERHVGRHNICPHIQAALEKAERLHRARRVRSAYGLSVSG